MISIVYRVEAEGRVSYNVPLNENAFKKSGFSKSVYIFELKKAKWFDIKASRDKKLSATDYTQMPDAPLSDAKKKEWAEYRQALRDLPQQYDNPDDVVWPTKPN